MEGERKMLEWKYAELSVERLSIEKVEKEWGITFPEAYVECVMKGNGGLPKMNGNDCVFTYIKEGEEEEDIFYYLHRYDVDSKTRHILERYESIQDRLPDKVYPFADTIVGYNLCFDYRQSTEEPRVVLWHYKVDWFAEKPEDALFFVADSFDSFLSSLTEFEDEWETEDMPEPERIPWTCVQGEINRSMVDEVEEEWGITFPEDYVACLLAKEEKPVPQRFIYYQEGEEKTADLDCLVPFDPEEAYAMQKLYRKRQGEFPQGVYPFAESTELWEYLCFDYRDLSSEPRVLFLITQDAEREEAEKGLFPVAASFSELVKSLS